MMTFERSVLPIYVLFVLVVGALAPVLVLGDFTAGVRWALCIQFVAGAGLSLVGYLRYIPPGPTIPFFLAILIVKSGCLFLLGIAFLFSALNDAPIQVTAFILVTYTVFGMVGAATLFNGVFAIAGAHRGWIMREVYKNPWSNGDKTQRANDSNRRGAQ